MKSPPRLSGARALRRGSKAPSGGESWSWGEHPDRTERAPGALPADEASIDQEVDTGAEAGGVADEEHGGTDELVDGRHASERGVGLELLHLVRDFRPRVHGCRCVARADRVHPYAAPAPFHREALAEVDHRRLGGVVVRLQ